MPQPYSPRCLASHSLSGCAPVLGKSVERSEQADGEWGDVEWRFTQEDPNK